MGQCRQCGALLISTKELAVVRTRTDRCTRLQLQSGELQGARFGGTWVIPEPPGEAVSRAGPAACPNCAEAWLSVSQAAAALRLPESTLYLLLKRRPGRLRAFRVGRRWVVPQSGVERYRALMNELDATDDVTENRIPEAPTASVEVITRPETCRCSAYPFPHRKGGGRCTG